MSIQDTGLLFTVLERGVVHSATPQDKHPILPNVSLVLLNGNTIYSSSHSLKYANTIRIRKLSELIDSGF